MADILVAEDDSSSREVLKALLAQLGHTVCACADGREAYETFLSEPARFTLVITDVAMPEMDGVTLCTRLREDHGVEIPIIATTAYEEKLFNAELRNHFDAWLMKPIAKGTLQTTLGYLVSSKL